MVFIKYCAAVLFLNRCLIYPEAAGFGLWLRNPGEAGGGSGGTLYAGLKGKGGKRQKGGFRRQKDLLCRAGKWEER